MRKFGAVSRFQMLELLLKISYSLWINMNFHVSKKCHVES